MEQIREGLSNGEFVPRDLAQQGGSPIWQPLVRFLDDSREPITGAIAPDWRCVLAWVWVRLSRDVSQGSFAVGAVATAIGAAVIAGTYWPTALWAPWLAVPVLAAFFALKHGRALAGVGLLLLVAVVSAGSFFLPKKSAAPPAPGLTSVLASVLASLPSPSLAAPPSEVPAGSESQPAAAPLADVEPEPLAADQAGPVAALAPTPPNFESAPQVPSLATSPAPTAVTGTLPPISSVKPNPEPAAAPAKGGDLAQRYSGALILIKASEGAGSGFVCQADGQVRFYTNCHVVAGMKQPQFQALNGTQMGVANPEAAVGRDIFRTTLNTAPSAVLEVVDNLEATVKIGDAITVLGNSGGGGVVTRLDGEVLGIGPDRIEVSAEFIPGNSGSPIIHVPSGKVIGIATYLTKRYEEFGKGGAGEKVRRFAYRVDKVERWQPVNWPAFQAEADQVRRIEQLTEDIFDFLGSLRNKSLSPNFATDTLRRPAMQWIAAVKRPHLSPADRESATRGFLSSLRLMVRNDITLANNQLRYDYFRTELSQQSEVRNKLYEAFDDDLKRMNTTSGRTGY